MADAADSKSAEGKPRGGSTPPSGTKYCHIVNINVLF